MALDGRGAPRFAVGAVISTSLKIVSHNLFRFLGIMLAIGIPALLVVILAAAVLATGAPGGGAGGGAAGINFASEGSAALFFLVLAVAGMLTYLVIQGAITYGTLQTLRGRAATIGTSLSHAFSALPRLFLAALLLIIFVAIAAMVPSMVVAAIFRAALTGGGPTAGTSVAVVASSLLVLGVGLAISVLAWVFVPAILVERAGPVACFQRSMALTKGRRWSICGLVLMLFIANFVVTLITKLLMQYGAPMGGAVLNGLAALFFMALTAVISAVGYYVLRAEKEGVAIDDVVSVFD